MAKDASSKCRERAAQTVSGLSTAAVARSKVAVPEGASGLSATPTKRAISFGSTTPASARRRWLRSSGSVVARARDSSASKTAASASYATIAKAVLRSSGEPPREA